MNETIVTNTEPTVADEVEGLPQFLKRQAAEKPLSDENQEKQTETSLKDLPM